MISSREFTKFGTTNNGSWIDRTYNSSSQITTMNSSINTLTRGNKQFELCNHLGNVLVTIQDRKRSVDLNSDNAADYYMPYLRTVTNYYAFGSAMPGIGGSVKECSVSSSTATLKKFPYYHTFSNDSISGFTPGSGARTVSNPTHNVLHLESVWNTRPLANKSIYLKSGVTYALKFNIVGFSAVSGYSHAVKVRILLPGSVLTYTYTATGNQTVNFTSNTTGYVTVEISSQINGTGTYSINPYIDIDNFNLSWDSTYNTSVNNCGTSPENYKYGFNTQEKDNEIAGENNIYSAEYWEYDSRVARRWNVDPVFKEYESPYICFGNNPICFVDINGRDTFNVVSTSINTKGEELQKGEVGLFLFKVYTNDAQKEDMGYGKFQELYQISTKNTSHKINGIEQAITYADVLFVNSTDPNFKKAINVTTLKELNQEYSRLKGLVGSSLSDLEKVKYFRQGSTGDYKNGKSMLTFVDGIGLFQSQDIGNFLYGMVLRNSGGKSLEALKDGDFIQMNFYIRKSFKYNYYDNSSIFSSTTSILTFGAGGNISQIDDCIDGYYLYAGGHVGVYIDAIDLMNIKSKFVFQKTTSYSQYYFWDFINGSSMSSQISVNNSYQIVEK